MPETTTADWPAGTDHRKAIPDRHSPSRLLTFKQCPQRYYFETVCGLRGGPTLPTAKGSLAHAAFERIFDHPPGERTPDVAVSYIAPAWQAMTDTTVDDEKARADAADHLELAAPGSAQEAEILADAERFVRNWFAMERIGIIDPTALVLPDGSTVDGREIHLAAAVGKMNLHGFVDRLDQWNDDGVLRWSITDYKTGKVPLPQYQDKYWFQLRVYALLAHALWGIRVDMLRLVFVKNGDRDDILTLTVTDEMLERTEAEVAGLYKAIDAAARAGRWPTKTGPLCNWCDFQDVCPAFAPQLDGVPVG